MIIFSRFQAVVRFFSGRCKDDTASEFETCKSSAEGEPFFLGSLLYVGRWKKGATVQVYEGLF